MSSLNLNLSVSTVMVSVQLMSTEKKVFKFVKLHFNRMSAHFITSINIIFKFMPVWPMAFSLSKGGKTTPQK